MKLFYLLTALFLVPASSIVAAENSSPLPTAEEVVARMAALDLKTAILH